MKYIIGAIYTNLTIGLLSGVSTAVNGIYTLGSNIMQYSSNRSVDIVSIITETDVEVKILAAQFLVQELSIDDNTPNTIRFCIQSIREAIDNVVAELKTIRFRIEYNENLWVGTPVRSYSFLGSKNRLHAKLKNLDMRCTMLERMVKIAENLTKDNRLNEVPEMALQRE